MIQRINSYFDNWRAMLQISPFRPGILERKALILKGGLILIFLAAGLIRLYHIGEPGVLIEREFTSAIFARAFYFDHTNTAADWQKEIATIAMNNQPTLEPPITEYLVSLIYRLIGSEALWVSHVLTTLFWLIGGIFLFKLAQLAVSTNAAIIATTYYLFTPLSITVSRSFQPDSLMMMLFLISLFGIFSYYEKPTVFRLLVVASVTGIALLVRPLVFFTLYGAFIALAISQTRSWKFIFKKDFIIFIVISLLPSTLYYGYGILFAGYLRWKVDSSFRPDLYLHREYWEGWLTLAVGGVGLLFLVAALLGMPTIRKSQTRYMLFGMWFGYIIFGLVFTMHIHTHGYYQAQLIPIVALSFSSLAALYFDYVKELEYRLPVWLPVSIVVLLVLFFDIQTVREEIGFQVFESKELSQEVGEVTNHSSHTVFISRYYGMPLQYFGELAGAPWPKDIEHPLYRRKGEKVQTIQERLDLLGFEPEYFVITDFDNYQKRHSDLKEYLEANCTLLAESDMYLIYDGRCN